MDIYDKENRGGAAAPFFEYALQLILFMAVSYTHLDVYKRQEQMLYRGLRRPSNVSFDSFIGKCGECGKSRCSHALTIC